MPHVRFPIRFLVLSIAVLANQTAFADVLFSQPARPVSTGGLFWTSQISPSGGGFDLWDDFSLSYPATVDAVDWYGSWYAPVGETSEPNVDEWTVAIYEDNSGLPGDVIDEQTFSLASVDSVLRGFHTGGGNNIAAYMLSANMSPIELAPGTYWLLTRATLASEPNPGWNWDPTTGDISEGIAIQRGHGPMADFIERPGDRAFTVHGVVVPEPSSMVLAAFGVLGLIAYGWRRRTQPRIL